MFSIFYLNSMAHLDFIIALFLASETSLYYLMTILDFNFVTGFRLCLIQIILVVLLACSLLFVDPSYFNRYLYMLL